MNVLRKDGCKVSKDMSSANEAEGTRNPLIKIAWQRLDSTVSNIFLLTGLRIYTGEYKAQDPTLCPTEGRALRGPRALYSPV